MGFELKSLVAVSNDFKLYNNDINCSSIKDLIKLSRNLEDINKRVQELILNSWFPSQFGIYQNQTKIKSPYSLGLLLWAYSLGLKPSKIQGSTRHLELTSKHYRDRLEPLNFKILEKNDGRGLKHQTIWHKRHNH